MLLQWYGNGNARFSFSLQGSTNSINSSCPNFNDPPPPSTTSYVADPLRVARRDSLRSVCKRCVRVSNFTINTVERNIENWGGVQLRQGENAVVVPRTTWLDWRRASVSASRAKQLMQWAHCGCHKFPSSEEDIGVVISDKGDTLTTMEYDTVKISIKVKHQP